MNRIDQAFEKKGNDLLNIYFTAGYPEFDSTVSILEALENGGADVIEIGMPFSDPVADGPTIQDSNQVALENGMTIAKLFEQLKDFREKVTVPVVLMGYINPVLQYGLDDFCAKCQEVGIDGLILPDLPMHEYLTAYKSTFEQYGLYNIFLITPQTSETRIKEIDGNSNGFIYMVSSASVTGAKKGVSDSQVTYFERIKTLGLKNPTMIGFGISDNDSFKKACAYANGAIIGSAFINLLTKLHHKKADLKEGVGEFVNQVKGKGI